MQLRITFAGATVGEVRPQEAELCAVLPVDAVAAKASEARMGAEAAARTLQAQDHAVPGRISVPASEQ